MSRLTPRDRAYAIVKKLKMAYSKEGCDLQVELEKIIAELIEDCVKVVQNAVEETEAWRNQQFIEVTKAVAAIRSLC